MAEMTFRLRTNLMVRYRSRLLPAWNFAELSSPTGPVFRKVAQHQ
jgi:hypothetical protein